ncbi:1-acyl-sn-glycerol-3-phosphate acyltransferase [Pedobacter sp. SD-b]|uniref:1-acyl-sn-glycerol-3-phosphate acyltransferase n=1 Tax=Pedobacter segetis TaxID=2793069 RepID=A0ABS1BF95_9SPHI|nr:lysophospholipid acyltransferase family protein [Pedobacter segetis]MBK0381527.1 1-acyl-sn-glycerol-3-phosphate acyltransferase [Pedobacter segetis]
MKRIIGHIFSPLHHLGFFLVLIIFQPIQWLCYKLGGYKAHKSSVDIMNFFLLIPYYFVFDFISFKNEQNLPIDRPIIFVANHQSMYDIPPLIYFLRKYHAKFISKIELTKNIPSISFNLKYGGGANIDRSDKKQSLGEIMKLGQRMRDNNWSTVIFPEGTRSKTGKMKEFQIGGIATILKKAPNALIVPIAIENSWKMVRYGLFWLNAFIPLKFTVLTPIEPAGKDIVELVKELEIAVKNVVEKDLD